MNNNCYHMGPRYLNQAYTWTQARKYCESISSELLVLSSRDEFDSIVRLIIGHDVPLDAYVYVGFVKV
jgi:hypothetical protein